MRAEKLIFPYISAEITVVIFMTNEPGGYRKAITLCVKGDIMIGQTRHRFANQQGCFLAFVKRSYVIFPENLWFIRYLTERGEQKHIRGFGGGNFKEKDHLEDLGLN
jgi:hypothetical protein